MHVVLGLYKQIQNGCFMESKNILCLHYLVNVCSHQNMMSACTIGFIIYVDLNSSAVMHNLIVCVFLLYHKRLVLYELEEGPVHWKHYSDIKAGEVCCSEVKGDQHVV